MPVTIELEVPQYQHGCPWWWWIPAFMVDNAWRQPFIGGSHINMARSGQTLLEQPGWTCKKLSPRSDESMKGRISKCKEKGVVWTWTVQGLGMSWKDTDCET
jgi:hypothetical protein